MNVKNTFKLGWKPFLRSALDGILMAFSIAACIFEFTSDDALVVKILVALLYIALSVGLFIGGSFSLGCDMELHACFEEWEMLEEMMDEMDNIGDCCLDNCSDADSELGESGVSADEDSGKCSVSTGTDA